MRSPRLVLAGLLGVLALSGCEGVEPVIPPPSPVAAAARNVQVSATFQIEPGTAITYDQELVKAGSRGAVQARSGDGSTTVKLALRGLEPERHYGAHAHAEPCGERPEDAGPHFQYSLDPVQPSVDPLYANPQNEIWLDLTADETGAGSAETTVAWQFPDDRRAGSVVVHAMPTATEPGEAGTAGARAACITVDF
jgi:Cu-Zn family superoxide dismutase